MKQSADLCVEKYGTNLFIHAIKPISAEPGRTTFSERKWFLHSSHMDIEEMAWSTSMQCRFTGFVRKRYSVAEHGILVSDLMGIPAVYNRGGTRFEALMHDTHEGYVSDLASPWKGVVKDYRPFEGIAEARMRAQFSLPEKINEGVKYADWLALIMEAEQLLMPGITADWPEPEPGTRDFAISLMQRSPRYLVAGYDQQEAFERFMATYHFLKPDTVQGIGT